jgi:hypothetical protein
MSILCGAPATRCGESAAKRRALQGSIDDRTVAFGKVMAPFITYQVTTSTRSRPALTAGSASASAPASCKAGDRSAPCG